MSCITAIVHLQDNYLGVNEESAAQSLQDAPITVSSCFVQTHVIIPGELQYAASDFPGEAAVTWAHWTHICQLPFHAESCPRPR